MVMALSASLLAAAVTAPAPSVASDDDEHALTHRKAQLGNQIARSHGDLDEISERLVNAQGRLDSAATDLADARATLDALHAEVLQATARDQRMQQALEAARNRLADARADFAQGQQTVSGQRKVLAAYAVSSAHTQLSQLSTLNLMFTADSTRAAISEVKGANSALDKQVTDLQRLQANQALLRYTEQRVRLAAAQVAADREAAAANLARKKGLEAAAATAATAVGQHVAELQVRQDRLASAKTSELSRIDAMERERAAVEARLRRIAAERAAAARRAAERRAAQERAAEQRAAEQRAADRRAAEGSGSAPNTSPTTSPTDGGYLSWPVINTYVTSSYGMRLHPILHIWKLHDGTDFHALCGTPVYAAADGRVLSEYYSTGYGNQLVIDHGLVNGVSLATSYNHLTSFVAGTGQAVSRGQIIAYSGTTGYSTGCHLHFMVYVNGVTVDPMTWL